MEHIKFNSSQLLNSHDCTRRLTLPLLLCGRQELINHLQLVSIISAR